MQVFLRRCPYQDMAHLFQISYVNIATDKCDVNIIVACIKCHYRRMAENGFAPPPPREFCRHILSCRELKAESFKRCLQSVLRGVSLGEPVTYVT